MTRLYRAATAFLAGPNGRGHNQDDRSLPHDDDHTDDWWPHSASSGHVVILPGTCWRCRKAIVRVVGVLVLADDSAGEFGLIPFDECAGYVASLVSDEVLAAAGAGPIRRRYSHTAREAYLSNGCLRCDAIQGNFFLSEELLEYQMQGRTLVELPRIARIPLPGSLVIRGWCLGDRPGHSYTLLGLSI